MCLNVILSWVSPDHDLEFSDLDLDQPQLQPLLLLDPTQTNHASGNTAITFFHARLGWNPASDSEGRGDVCSSIIG